MNIKVSIKNKEDFERALSHDHWYVRVTAVRSKFFESKHMEIVLNDKDYYVITRAMLSNSNEIIKNLDNLMHYATV